MKKFKYDNVEDWKIYYQTYDTSTDELLDTSAYRKSYKRYANAEKMALKLAASCPKDVKFVFDIRRENPFFKKCDICKVTYSIKPRIIPYFPLKRGDNTYIGSSMTNMVHVQYHDFNEKDAVYYRRGCICPICAKKIINYIETMKGDKNE